MDQQLSDRIDEINADKKMLLSRKRVEVGRALREAVKRLKDEGKTEVEISELTGLRTTRVRELSVEIRGSSGD